MRSNFLSLSRLPFLAASFCLLLNSCSKPKAEENNPPETFTVSVTNVTATGASLQWTAAKDPENEAITYRITVNSQTVVSDLSATTYSLSNLIKNTAYSGTVSATDASGASTVVSFSFTTSDSPTPSDFTIRVADSTNKSLTVAWTPSTLPNGEAVTYDVSVDNNLKATGIAQTTYLVTGLLPATAYSVKVVAKSASGKSAEKTLGIQTKSNAPPTAFQVQEVQTGFSYIKVSWTATTDTDSDSISYSLRLNGVVTPLVIAAVGNVYTYVVKGFGAETSQSIAVEAKDSYGAQVLSNTLAITTNKGPQNNFLFAVKNDGSNVVLEWIHNYTSQFVPAQSSYFINGTEKSLSNVQLSFLPIANGQQYVKIMLPSVDFPNNATQQVKLKLHWNDDEAQTQSKINTHTRYTFAATSAQVSSAVIKKYSNGDYGYVLKFQNDIISDNSQWTVKEVKLENAISGGTTSIQFASGQTVQSVFGSLSEEEFNYLKTKSEGFIIVEDAGGFHRLNFSYTIL